MKFEVFIVPYRFNWIFIYIESFDCVNNVGDFIYIDVGDVGDVDVDDSDCPVVSPHPPETV